METLKVAKSEKQYHHGDLRNALIAAGLQVLAEAGIEGLNLSEVARRVGVSHAAPYRHFADKEALIAAIAEDGFQRMGEWIVAAVAQLDRTQSEGTQSDGTQSAGNWRERVQAVGRGYVGFAVENRDAYRLMFSHVIAHRHRYPALYTAAKQGFNLLTELIQQGQVAGEFGEDDTTTLTVSVWSMFHGLASLLIEDQPGSIDFHMNLITASLRV